MTFGQRDNAKNIIGYLNLALQLIVHLFALFAQQPRRHPTGAGQQKGEALMIVQRVTACWLTGTFQVSRRGHQAQWGIFKLAANQATVRECA